MSIPFDNLAGVTTTSGTVNFVISGNLGQYEPIIGNVTDAVEVSYKAVYVDATTDGSDYETGKGSWASGTNTLTRTTVNTSSNSGNAVNWSGSSVAVYIVLDAETLNSMANKTETADRKILTGDERTAIAGALQESALTSASGVKTLNVPDSTTITTYARTLVAASDATNARTVLALGGAADLDVGTTTGTVAAGDDSRLTGTEVSALTVTDTLDGAELIPMDQSGVARAATTETVGGSPTSSSLGHSKSRLRFFSHLYKTTPTYANSTDGTLWGNDTHYVHLNGTGTEVTQEADGTLRYGCAECTTGTTATGRAAITNTYYPIYFVTASTRLDFRYIAAVDIAPTVSEDYIAQVGLFTVPSAVATAGAFFRAKQGETNWQAVVKNSVGETESDTGIPVTNANVFGAGWEAFRVDFDATDTTPAWRFYINGNTTPVATITDTANYPAAIKLLSGVAIFKSAGTTERSVYLDAESLDIYVGTNAAQYL